jgi:hypothetical protein
MSEKITIKIKAHLDETWAEWFDGMKISYEGDMTVLSGENMDKAYLHGMLNRIRDLNLKLISVDTTEDSAERLNSKNQ